MREILSKYLPENAVVPVSELIKMNGVHLKIVNETGYTAWRLQKDA